MDDLEKSRKLIKPFVGRRVQAQLDGVLFDDQPNTFAFRFCDPGELRDAIADMHCDEMDMEPWCDVVPVAAVSVPDRTDEEFAWIFLDWRDGDQPGVLVATSDNWGGGLKADGLDALALQIA